MCLYALNSDTQFGTDQPRTLQKTGLFQFKFYQLTNLFVDCNWLTYSISIFNNIHQISNYFHNIGLLNFSLD
jgi:hypothetical protein